MKKDILLCGVGGQGILSLAYVLDHSAVASGFHFKQPEVHGMAQRGGAVSAQLRISDTPVASGLIPAGGADLVLSLEPMEALRYLSYLSSQCCLVTDMNPHVNIADYPELDKLCEVLFCVPGVLVLDGEHLARRAGVQRAQNMVILGASADHLPFAPELVEQGIEQLFSAKDEKVLRGNLNAFRRGRSAGQFFETMRRAGGSSAVVSRVLPRLDFQPWPIPEEILAAWKQLFQSPHLAEIAEVIWSEKRILPLDAEVPQRLLAGSALQVQARAKD